MLKTAVGRTGALIGLALMSLAAIGCGAEENATGGGSADVAPAVEAAMREEGPIELLEFSSWTGGSIEGVLLARVLETAGATVELVQMPDGTTQWAAMAKADNAVAHQMWDLAYPEQFKQYVDEDRSVVKIGESALVAEEGWYVPDYVIRGDPERGIEPSCPGLPDWRALNDCTDVFATAETGSKGRYLSGAKAWGKYYGDTLRIKNLDLDYEMKYAGSEAALAAEIKRAYERGEPILALMWKPSYVTLKYPMTRVELPRPTGDCWGTTYACNWPDIKIWKLASGQFPRTHPTAMELVERFDLTNEQLISIITEVEEKGASVDEAVADWMQANPTVWKAWIPTEPAGSSAS